MVALPGLMATAFYGVIGLDARIYRVAAHAALSGGDPWARQGALGFAGTPTSLIAYVPAAILPETVAVAAYIGLFVVGAVLVLRRLRLPAWWLLSPPLWESVELVNQDLLA